MEQTILFVNLNYLDLMFKSYFISHTLVFFILYTVVLSLYFTKLFYLYTLQSCSIFIFHTVVLSLYFTQLFYLYTLYFTQLFYLYTLHSSIFILTHLFYKCTSLLYAFDFYSYICSGKGFNCKLDIKSDEQLKKNGE